MVVAVGFLSLAALGVLGAALSGSWLLATIAAAVATALGIAAVRITHRELLDSRRDAARDRAEQARAYRVITEVRTAEQALYVAETSGRMKRHEATISRLEGRLAAAADELTEAQRTIDAERRQAQTVQRERDRFASRLDEAEERAALAIVRVVELENELDVVRSQWQAEQVAPQRKRA